MASLGLVGSLSGCSSVPIVGDDGGGGGGGADDRINRVPEGSMFVVHVSVGEMLADDEVTQRMNELLQDQTTQEDQPQSIEDAFSEAESELGFNPRDVSEMLAFGNQEDETAGSILWTGWEQSAVTSALTDNGYTEDSYSGTTVYTRQSSAEATSIARLEETTYAFGTQESIETVIDTWNGDAPSVSGNVETGFTDAQGGYVQFAFDVPEQDVPQDTQSGMNLQAINNVQYGYGSVTDASAGREMQVKLEATDGDAASGIKGLVDIGLGTAEQQLQQSAQQPGADTEEIQNFQNALSNVETSASGSTVTISNSDGITFAVGALAVAATFVLGVGSSSATGSATTEGVRPPQATFSVDYDGSSLEITHAGGDSIRADRLFVMAGSTVGQSWAELDGSMSGSGSDAPMVQAGDSVTLNDVSSDYELSIIWRGEGTSRVLYQDSGPGA